ncbi:MAG: MFS transporter [Planctomycetes bacterium]|nr:MFS transporter [Planctomycetota bacterium]
MNDELLGPVRGRGLRTAAWVLYDLANTVYAATLTFLFTPWFGEQQGGLTGLAVVNFASMIVAGLVVPALGALVDHTTRTRRYLTVATLMCILALACWRFEFGTAWLLGCFFVANLAYNLSLLFYNSLLPSVAPPDRAGRVSALGVGVGYFATILVLIVLLELDVAPPNKFPIAGGLFLAFALPCLLLVRDRRRPDAGSTAVAVRAAFRTLKKTLRELPRHPSLFWFLLANFCFVDVLNTAVLFFAELTKSTFAPAAAAGTIELVGIHFDGDDGLLSLIKVCGLSLNGLALVYGLSIGRWTDRAPLAVIATGGIALFGALVGGAMFAGESALGDLLTLVALGAFGLTAIQAAGRKVIVLLAPRDQVGQYFGLYGITLKLSVFGGVIYGVVRDTFDAKAALLAQSPQLLLGLVFLAMVRLPKREGAA